MYIVCYTYIVTFQERILKQRYTSLTDMEDDMMLLCQNARTYNEEGSQVSALGVVGAVRNVGVARTGSHTCNLMVHCFSILSELCSCM